MVMVAASFIVIALMLLFFLGLRFLQNNMGASKFFKKFSGTSINIKEVAFIDPKNKLILFDCEGVTYLGMVSPQNSYFLPHIKNFSHTQGHVSE